MKSFVALTALASLARAQFCEHQWEGDFAKRSRDDTAHMRRAVAPPPLDIQPLIVTGPSQNRIDFIFFGDGYTEDEKDKFFADAMALAMNVTDGQTFADVVPLMNFWAGFSPSAESGVGVNGEPLDTVYGLYRPGSELRGVYYEKPDVAHAACDSTEACDYAILLGNSELYGGLGGEFTVITASPVNGPAVLRHELGHSIIDVGEEYEGGQVYSGVNSAHNTSSVPWTQWYTDPASEPMIQRSNMPIQAYPWTFLNTTQKWCQSFDSAGIYDSYLLQFSLSGMTASSDLRVELDGKDVEWEINQEVGVDRYIYNMKMDSALSPGKHDIAFTLLNEAIQGEAQLCNLEIIEYGIAEEEFHFEPGYVGLYPTFSDVNRTTYRPTNDDCTMRNIYSPDYCSACLEGMWLNLLEPLSLIDNITQTAQTAQPNGSTKVDLTLLPLAEFRKIPNPHQEAYTITWYGNEEDVVLEQWSNSTSATLEPGIAEFTVEVRFSSEQIRVDKKGTLVEKKRYMVI
ncbi:IgA peptidase M64-domain-containing protein [Astrocystis sublimbata]|nr:IgA peptidase M64-domain-containing protein [Astrocystis sublimbata]